MEEKPKTEVEEDRDIGAELAQAKGLPWAHRHRPRGHLTDPAMTQQGEEQDNG